MGKGGWVVAAGMLFSACSAPAPVTHQVGGLDVDVYPDPARLRIRAGDRVLFDGLAGGSAAATEPPHVGFASRAMEASYEFQFGAFRIEEGAASAWRGVTRFSNIRADAGQIRFDLRGRDDRPLGAAFIHSTAERTVSIELDFDGDVNRASVAFNCAAGEHFLGLGGQSYDVDHRGQTVPLWVQEQGVGKVPWDDYDNTWFITGRRHSAYAALPMYLSSRGYALALDTNYRSVFALCSEADDVVRVEAWEPRLALHLFDGPEPTAALRRMTDWTGRPALPPAFAFAPWIDAIFGSDNVRRVIARLRAEDIAASAIWTEDWRGGIDSAQGYQLKETWAVDTDLYPDFGALTDEVHAAGFKFLTYNNSFVEVGTPVYDQAAAAGYTIQTAAGEPYTFVGKTFSDTSLIDLTNPAAVAWTIEQYRSNLGNADGYMADFGEWLPVDAVLASGADGRAEHNRYPVRWQQLNKQLLDSLYEVDGVDRLFFVRSAYLGSQPLVSVIWAGDQETEFDVDDGIPTIIPLGIGLGVTGFPYFGHDIGGYLSIYTPTRSRELYFRWLSLGALSPVMRTHHGTHARDNWNWESDAASTDHMRRWARFHTQLLPYLYRLAADASERGVPMMRALALHYPSYDQAWTLTDQYMLGDRLIVAPVISEATTSREVWLPGGTFYRLMQPGGRVDADAAGSVVKVSAALTEIPVFVRAGSVLVLLPDTVDTVVDADPATGLVRLQDVGDDRHIWLWPGGSSTWTEVSGLRYQWDAADVTALPDQASFNGAPVSVSRGEGWVRADVIGPGTLSFGSAGTLIIEGGAPTRQLSVWLRL